MADSQRVPIAQLPAGQPISLTLALLGFIGAVVDGAELQQGKDRSVAATIVAAEGQTGSEVASLLDHATRRITGTDSQSTSADGGVTGPELGDDYTVQQMSITPDGVAFAYDPGDGPNLADHLWEIFGPELDRAGAENYLEYTSLHRETGQRMCLIVVRPGGKRPSELRADAEAEAERLRALLAAHGINPDSEKDTP